MYSCYDFTLITIVTSVVFTLITYEDTSCRTRTANPCPGTAGRRGSAYMLYPVGDLGVTSPSCVSWRHTQYGWFLFINNWIIFFCLCCTDVLPFCSDIFVYLYYPCTDYSVGLMKARGLEREGGKQGRDTQDCHDVEGRMGSCGKERITALSGHDVFMPTLFSSSGVSVQLFFLY